MLGVKNIDLEYIDGRTKRTIFQMCPLTYIVGSLYLYWDLQGRGKALYYTLFPY